MSDLEVQAEAGFEEDKPSQQTLNEDSFEEEAEAEDQAIEEADEDPFVLLDESNEDNEVEQRQYQEYLALVKEIDQQNDLINELKTRAHALKQQNCKTPKIQREYKRLLICQEQEDVHLRNMINRAIQLQNFGSRRLYGDLEMEITDQENDIYLAGTQRTTILSTCSPEATKTKQCCQAESDSDDEFCMT